MPDYAVTAAGEEAFSAAFQGKVRGLNDIVRATGASLEGNLFYFDRAADLSSNLPDSRRAHKRRNLLRALAGKRRLLEVGFNAGHSALLALSAAPDLAYVGVDIGSNAYTQLCARLMARWFDGRFRYVEGDSRIVLPQLREEGAGPFDLIHIDGGHTAEICRADIANALQLADPRGGHILLDDTADPAILAVLRSFLTDGRLAVEEFSGAWEGSENLCMRVGLAAS